MLAVFLLGGVLPAFAERSLPSSEECLACHGDRVDQATFQGSVHGSLPCLRCHTDATAIPHPEALGKVRCEGCHEVILSGVHASRKGGGPTCSACHGSHGIRPAQGTEPGSCMTCHGAVVKVYGESVHGRALARGEREMASCRNCHGSAHEVRRVRDHASPVYPLNLPRTCGTCHGDPELARRHGIPVANAYQLYMDSIHGRALARSGLLVAANCSSCHGFHEIRPKDDPASKVYRTNIPGTCGACHAGVLDDYFEGVHGEAVRAGKLAAPVCVDCHTAHEIARVETVAWQLEIVRECGTCHKESLRTYRDTFHGQVTALGFTRVARCSDCHGSHRILPASNPRSSIAPANLVTTCRKCHPGANENFVRFSPHADPTNRERNPGLYYAARFMNILMIGVFAFFGLHTSLWLSRSLLERARLRRPPEELKEPDHNEGEGGDGAPDP